MEDGFVAQMTLNPAEFRAALRQVPGAVAVIAAGSSGGRIGLTATAVTSVSDDPPTMLVCINRAASAHAGILSAGHFSINMLAGDQQEIGDVFAGRSGLKGEDRFRVAGRWDTLTSGAPVLIDALTVLDCMLIDARPVATHSVLIGRVLGATIRDGADALVYRDGRYTVVG